MMAVSDPEYRIRLRKIEDRLVDSNSELNINGLLVSDQFSLHFVR